MTETESPFFAFYTLKLRLTPSLLVACLSPFSFQFLDLIMIFLESLKGNICAVYDGDIANYILLQNKKNHKTFHGFGDLMELEKVSKLVKLLNI